MFSSLLKAPPHSRLLCSVRYLSQVAQKGAAAPVAEASALPKKLPYFIPRNSRGNTPVYSDVRNGGTRYWVYLRGVEGNVPALVKDLRATLLPKGTPDAKQLHIEISNSKNLIISGGRWKTKVMEWVKERGF